jgi:putative transposase
MPNACEVESKPLKPTRKQVGVDLGVRHLAITSDEQFFESPKPLRKAERQLKT